MKHLLSKSMLVATAFRSHAPWFRAKWAVLKELAPYAAMALILPGGSVLAILYWFHRKKGRITSAPIKAALTEIARRGPAGSRSRHAIPRHRCASNVRSGEIDNCTHAGGECGDRCPGTP